MKLLRVIASMDPASGGPCQGIRNSIPELEQLGIYNEVVCLDAPSSGFSAKDPFPTHCLNGRKGPWAYNPLLLNWLLNHLQNYDAVIVHGLWLYPGFAVKKAIDILNRRAKRASAKVGAPKMFVMPHGMLDPYFQKAESRRIKAARNWIFWKLVERNIVNQADAVLFTCQSELQLARLPFRPYRPKKELNVGYGIETPPSWNHTMQEVSNELIHGKTSPSYLLFLSRLHEKKGVDLLIDAYAAIIGTCPDLPNLVIAGPGLDSPYGQYMLQKVATHGLCKRIVFTGMLSGEAKWGAFYGCDAFILPSHQENFGISVVEAMACGKPVLISNKVNIWQEIDQCNAGIICDDTFEGAKELLEGWIQMPTSKRKQMGRNAQVCYKQHFAIAQFASNISRLLQELPKEIQTTVFQ